MLNQFSRTELLFGRESMEKLSRCRVAVFGIGGVGGYVVEALLGSSVKFYFFLLWEGVAALLILWNFYECRKRRWKSLECEKLDENIFIMKGIKKAKVCGFFRPVIYLPEGLDEQVRKEVLKRKHRLIDSGGQKLTVAASVITFLYWFNPVLWLSLYYMKEDLKRL